VRFSWFLVSFLVALAACTDSEPTAPAVEAAVAANAIWQPRADYPTDLYFATSASYTNPSTLKATLYVIGGALSGQAGQITDRVRAYNASANTWSVKADLPIRLRDAHQAVQLNGKIYVSGGFTRYWDASAGVWRLKTSKALYVYDVAKNTWTRKADLPTSNIHGVRAAYNGFVYVAASCLDDARCGDTEHGAVWRYNPSTDRWTLESRVPNGDTWRSAGGFIGGKLYVVDALGATDIYNVTTKVWTTGPKRPYRYCQATTTTFQAKLYLANCANDNGSDPAMLVFDPKTNTWTQLPVAPEGNYATMTRVVVNGSTRLELVGGPKAGSNWQYVP
jgi:N-acetylneuraminic acid mutarotase